MGACKKTQMSTFDDDWPDQIWSAVCAVNNGKGAAWSLAVAALAVTGCRPASLEKGIIFAIVKHEGKACIEAVVPGSKLTSNRGQPEYRIRWNATDSHRPAELLALAEAIASSPTRRIVVQYDAEAISSRLREVSVKLWPRRKNKISGYCYRELLSSVAKESGAAPEEIAMAMGHLSTESQGKYARARPARRGGKKPWSSVQSAKPVKAHRSPMSRFKANAAIKKAAAKAQNSSVTKLKIRRSI